MQEGGGEGFDWEEARTPEDSGVKGGETLLWMRRTRTEAEAQPPPKAEKAQGVRKVEDKGKAERVQTCPL